ncbi:hypothetical protein Clacol_005805 [Clathrus columnatus]|uniref:Elongator complex protein 6 n=1 Tax=Clathrus columnatus TaxID=1419009 RepID=A0AAV5AF85_9AGAM|nr:hypothetical protein Clacol_005805 [Clathrus columnatus]
MSQVFNVKYGHHIASSADFILHRVLAQNLQRGSSVHITLISLEREFAQWRAIAAKNNIQLSTFLQNGNMTYIDGLSISASSQASSGKSDMGPGYYIAPSIFQDVDKVTLHYLYTILETTLQSTRTKSHMLIFDSPSILEFLGVPSLEITRFIRAVLSLYRSNSTSSLVLFRGHITSPLTTTTTPFDTPVLRLLVSLAHAHVEVLSLRTGRSGAVSGEVCVHPGIGDLVNRQGGRRTAIQYKLTDSGVVFFQKGMSKGVL